MEPIKDKNTLPSNTEAKRNPVNENVAISNSISFSCYQWKTTDSPNDRKAPGNNYWSSKGVWVDQNGYLHLTLTKDPKSNKWYCTQLVSELKFGKGIYEFWIEGRVDQLDKNVVFGLFNYAGVDYFDEMDIEFSKWGTAKNPNLHYTVYPEEFSTAKIWSSSFNFSLDGPYSVHRIMRSDATVKFESQYDFQGTKTNVQTYSSPYISKKEMPIYMNLWQFQNKAPSNKKEVEIIIRKFVFTPLL
ncbi:LamG domain-containing protein [Pedobacter insulae]|uniref:GH16 domain-containing protein n=1 Tax=Pedobacter insulae TaxID=414048 RepID=A0A1I2UUD3_9SPHI|nr:glycoside hydrolase family 16 protein [Pedobacter insulae]SFG78371.1 hypothetical protein SAMN04489864_102247 [Pedobacter insulae]